MSIFLSQKILFISQSRNKRAKKIGKDQMTLQERAHAIAERMWNGRYINPRTVNQFKEIIVDAFKEVERGAILNYHKEHLANLKFGPSVSLMNRNAELETEIFAKIARIQELEKLVAQGCDVVEKDIERIAQAKRDAFLEAAKIAEDTNYKHKPELMSGEIWLRDTIAEKLRAKAGNYGP